MSADRFLVLHGLRLKGFAEAGTIASLYRLDESDVALELKALAEDGLVLRRDGRVSGWSLTADGRAAEAQALRDELERTGTRGAIDGAYQRFRTVNPELLEVCTAWQLKSVDGSTAINDHTDAAYDASVVDRLGTLHAQADSLLADVASTLPRFVRYPERLAHALAKVQAGQTEWFTKPLLDSYHTVWFELHEDLLSTLGIQRGAEAR